MDIPGRFIPAIARLGDRPIFWMLDERGVPQATEDVKEWSAWFQQADRKVAHTVQNDVLVSTVFLGIDHNFMGEGPPELYESMVFKGPLDGEQQRYTSLEDALIGHERLCELAFGPAPETDTPPDTISDPPDDDDLSPSR